MDLIIGGCGFLGRGLRRTLNDQKRAYVWVDWFAEFSMESQSDPKYLKYSDLFDEKQSGIWRKVKTVYFVAGLSKVCDCERDPSRAVELNVTQPLLALDYLKRFGTKAQFIFASSEYAVCPFKTIYGATKLLAEKALISARTSNTNVLIVRIGSVFGGITDSPLDKLIQTAFSVGQLIYRGSAETTRNIIYIEDICEWLINGLSEEQQGCLRPYSYNRSMPIKVFCEHVIDALGLFDSPIEFVERSEEHIVDFHVFERSHSEPGYVRNIKISKITDLKEAICATATIKI